MTVTPNIKELVNQKLEAFERIRDDFEASFRFVQDVHGQQRLPTFPVSYSVRYLHALWVCECKDRLLSIYKNIERYEGKLCLKLLRGWQEGNTADMVEFLQRKLDMLPLPDITRQLQEARRQGGDYGLIRRLEHGRLIMLNRGMNLLHAFDAIFALPEDDLMAQVREACKLYGHQLGQIEQQLAEIDSPIYAYVPHQRLAQCNIAVMNKLGVKVLVRPTDQPGERSWKVLAPTEPMSPFAEQIIEGYQELTSPQHNNPRGVRFVDRPERSDTGMI